MTQVDLVQVQVEDLILREISLDPKGEDGLPDLAGDTPLGGEEQGLGHLLGDGAPALAYPAAMMFLYMALMIPR